ncbi:hypothetical protein C7B69_00260 [filamentous cyanobacterium Phorm 46]|nr:hypothetical protein C7B69_00260 [filamentous cyanobacterium Phorm 46]
MQFTENEFRDYLFNHHKESISELIVGRREPVSWQGDEFPPLSFLLQQITEQKINKILDGLESLVIIAQELRLEKTGDSTTRVDLFGNSETNGLTIIELKKSKQTERQAYTELLAYANHFCSIFPGITEGVINSVLIAPMESRTVRDAFAQEILANDKFAVALIPKQDEDKITLSVYYPDKSYYQWFQNNLLDDRSMLTVAISFPIIDGWIDIDQETGRNIPDYSKVALNTISNTISYQLEAGGYHSLVYASQNWGEIAKLLPYPNTIYVVVINPFASFRSGINKQKVSGESALGRLAEIQEIYDQLDEDQREFWIKSLESNFHDFVIRTVREEFERCFRNTDQSSFQSEISIPDWYGLKTSMIDSVFTHNLDIYLSGLLRKIYMSYVDYMYNKKEDDFYYSDDLPKYSYDTLRDFLPVWEILRGLGLGKENA